MPPKKVTNPNIATICMNNFFFRGNFIDKIENRKINTPRYDGMYDVKDELFEIKLITAPHNTKKIP